LKKLYGYWWFSLLLCGTASLGAAADSGHIALGNTNDFARANGRSRFIVAEATSDYMGTNWTSLLRAMDLKDSPLWTGEEKPPLAPKKAEGLAKAFLGRRLPVIVSQKSVEPWHFHQMALRRVGSWDVWFYEVALVPLLHDSYNWPPVKVFVTMDGKVSPLEPNDLKNR
jgi:hypothetical protein